MENSKKSVFGQLVNSQNFLQALELLLNLSEEAQSRLFDAYISSEYRNYYCIRSERLARIIGTGASEAHDIFHVFDFLAFKILPENEPEEVVQALNSLKFDAGKSARLKTVLIKLYAPETLNKLKILDLIDDEIGAINLLPRITYHIDQRIVLQDDKIIKTLPMVIMQFTARHSNMNKLTFELTGEEIELLAEQLLAIKNQLSILKKQPQSNE